MTKVFQSDKTIKILTVLFLAVLVCSIFMMFASDAFAAGGPDVGKNIGTWLKEQALWMAICCSNHFLSKTCMGAACSIYCDCCHCPCSHRFSG